MLIAAVLCLCAAAATAAAGIWLLTRPRSGDFVGQVLRAVAPTQLAAAVMLAAGGGVALSARPETGLVVVIVCVLGAVATVAAGCWQNAKVVSAQGAGVRTGTGVRTGAGVRTQPAGCGGVCATCTLSCR